MSVFSYLRVSNDKLDLKNQQHANWEYANAHKLGNLIEVQDIISTRKKMEARKIYTLLTETSQRGDTVIASEVSRLGRNTLEVLELAKIASERGIKIIITKQNIQFSDSIESKIYVTVLGLVAEIERDFIQQRTKTALSNRKAQITERGYFISKTGKRRTSLGNEKGSKYKLKLDKQAEEIDRLLTLGLTKINICRAVGCSQPTLERWLKRTNRSRRQIVV